MIPDHDRRRATLPDSDTWPVAFPDRGMWPVAFPDRGMWPVASNRNVCKLPVDDCCYPAADGVRGRPRAMIREHDTLSAAV